MIKFNWDLVKDRKVAQLARQLSIVPHPVGQSWIIISLVQLPMEQDGTKSRGISGVIYFGNRKHLLVVI